MQLKFTFIVHIRYIFISPRGSYGDEFKQFTRVWFRSNLNFWGSRPDNEKSKRVES